MADNNVPASRYDVIAAYLLIAGMLGKDDQGIDAMVELFEKKSFEVRELLVT